MKPSRITGSLCLALLVSFLPAKWGSSTVEQLCLSLIPGWADRAIYSALRPLLSEDIGNAAVQMDFIEVWLVSFIILAAVMITILFFFNTKSGDPTKKQELDSA